MSGRASVASDGVLVVGDYRLPTSFRITSTGRRPTANATHSRMP
jgi:hypothetical protein